MNHIFSKEIPFEKSFISCVKKTKSGKLIIDCLTAKNISSRKIYLNSNKKLEFKCPDCNHIIMQTPAAIQRHGLCIYCAKQKICKDEKCDFCYNNSFASCDKRTKSGKMIIDHLADNHVNIRNIYIGSGTGLNFKCPDCKHDIKRSPREININRWCNFCSGKELCDDKTCITCFKHSFASCDNKTKSGKLIIECWIDETTTPRKINLNSNKDFLFKCPDCYHNFNQKPNRISSLGNWCKYCASITLCDDEKCNYCYEKSFSSFKGLTSKGDKIIDRLIDCDPRNIFKVSGKKKKFNCDTCGNIFHKHINNITINNGWCGWCKNKTEGKFKFWLSRIYQYKVEYQKRFFWCKLHFEPPFDFVIEELKLIIEVDGGQHFEKVKHWNSDPEEVFKRDKFKLLKAIENGYTVIRILQIDIWNDKNNWKENTIKAIKKYDKSQLICIGCPDTYKDYLKIKY
jgi:hypothetical protein